MRPILALLILTACAVIPDELNDSAVMPPPPPPPPSAPVECDHQGHEHQDAGECLDLRLEALRVHLEARR